MAGLSTYTVFKQMILDNENLHMLTPEDVKNVQKVLLYMMDDIHECCKKHDFPYVFCGGGAIGAVRHGGFIPWDDDIDICLARREYDQFRECFLAEYGDRYDVQEIRACEKYDLNFMKVRLKDGCFREFLDPDPEVKGFFIDILPIENVYDGKLRRKWQGIMADGMQFICSCMRIRKKKEMLLELAGNSEEAAHLIRVKSRIALPFSLFSFRRWLLWTEKVLMQNPDHNSKDVSIPTGGKHFRGEIYPREWMFPPRELPFAGRNYCFMAELDQYLTMRYGDYMTLPPESQREQHALMEFELPQHTNLDHI